MAQLVRYEPILEKVQSNLLDCGISSSINEERLDFEDDFLDISFLKNRDSVGNSGSLMLKNSPIDYIQILKKQELVKCDYAIGSHVGMGMHRHAWWKMRYFLAFPDSIHLGPLSIGTIATIKKGRFRTTLEEYVWNGYQKLTTLPPGIIRDNVVEPLNADQRLRQLITKLLIKERKIIISRYSPKKESKLKQTNCKIVIESKWKTHNEFLPDKDTLEMYETMAEIIKKTVNDLKYHLR